MAFGIGGALKRGGGRLANKLPFGIGEQIGDISFLGVGESSIDAANRARRGRGQSPLSREQISASNVFSRLTPAQQKDMLINNPNIETALGNQFFDPATNTIRLTESPFVKAQRERQEGLAAGLTEQLGGDLPGTDPSARFEQGRELLAPQFEEDRERLSQQLADQGLPRGSEAHAKELDRLERSQGTQLQNLAFNSVQTAEAQRAARFNEISSLLGQQQVGGTGFGDFNAQRSGLDLFGAEQAGLNRQFQAAQSRKDRSAAQRSALTGAFGSFGSGLASGIGSAGGVGKFFSDRTLKENIEKIGESESGIPIYHFDYKNKKYGQFRYEGVMAQDLKELKPEALITFDDGLMAVNYDMLDVEFRRVN
jgi:hypothetical protein